MKAKDLKIESEEIELAGNIFSLNLDMNALVELEDIYGDVKNAFKGFKQKPMKELRKFLYAMLKSQIDGLTIEMTGRLITANNLNTVYEKINKVINDSFPQAENIEANETETCEEDPNL